MKVRSEVLTTTTTNMTIFCLHLEDGDSNLLWNFGQYLPGYRLFLCVNLRPASWYAKCKCGPRCNTTLVLDDILWKVNMYCALSVVHCCIQNKVIFWRCFFRLLKISLIIPKLWLGSWIILKWILTKQVLTEWSGFISEDRGWWQTQK